MSQNWARLFSYNDNHIIYATVIGKMLELTNVKIYKKQRALQIDHLYALKRHQIKHKDEKGFFDVSGTIVLAKTAVSDTMYIIDGQHRYRAFQLLKDDGYISIDDKKHLILMELYIVKNETDMYELFRNINSCEPAAYSDIEHNEYVDECTKHLIKMFPKAFSTQKNAEGPNLQYQDSKILY